MHFSTYFTYIMVCAQFDNYILISFSRRAFSQGGNHCILSAYPRHIKSLYTQHVNHFLFISLRIINARPPRMRVPFSASLLINVFYTRCRKEQPVVTCSGPNGYTIHLKRSNVLFFFFPMNNLFDPDIIVGLMTCL